MVISHLLLVFLFYSSPNHVMCQQSTKCTFALYSNVCLFHKGQCLYSTCYVYDSPPAPPGCPSGCEPSKPVTTCPPNECQGKPTSMPIVTSTGSAKTTQVPTVTNTGSAKTTQVPTVTNTGSAKTTQVPTVTNTGSAKTTQVPIVTNTGSAKTTQVPIVTNTGSAKTTQVPTVTNTGSAKTTQVPTVTNTASMKTTQTATFTNIGSMKTTTAPSSDNSTTSKYQMNPTTDPYYKRAWFIILMVLLALLILVILLLIILCYCMRHKAQNEMVTVVECAPPKTVTAKVQTHVHQSDARVAANERPTPFVWSPKKDIGEESLVGSVLERDKTNNQSLTAESSSQMSSKMQNY